MNLILIKIPSINIYGAAYSSIVAQTVGFLISYYTLKKKLDYKINRKDITKSIFVSVMMGIIVFASYTLMYKNIIKSNLITLMISILIGIVSYLLMVIKFEVISREELQTIPLGNKIVAILDRQDEIKEGRKRVKNRRERNRKI